MWWYVCKYSFGLQIVPETNLFCSSTTSSSNTDTFYPSNYCFLFIIFNIFFGTMIQRRNNRCLQQAPLLYYWNSCLHRHRRRRTRGGDPSEGSSEQNSSLHISLPSVIYITVNSTSMAPQQSSGRKADTLNYGMEETKHLFDISWKGGTVWTWVSQNCQLRAKNVFESSSLNTGYRVRLNR